MVRVPWTWENAGYYERQLRKSQIEGWVVALLDAGALDTSSSRLRSQVGAVERQRRTRQLQSHQNKPGLSQPALASPPEVFAVSDDETVELTLSLDRFRGRSSSVTVSNLKHQLNIDNLHMNARAYTELPQLRKFSDVVRQIEALANTEKMTRRDRAP